MPDSCTSETIVETTAEQLATCRDLGISETGCNEVEIAKEIAERRAHESAVAAKERKVLRSI